MTRSTARALATAGLVTSFALLGAAPGHADTSLPDGIWVCYQYKTFVIHNPDGLGQEAVPVPVPLPSKVATEDPHCPAP